MRWALRLGLIISALAISGCVGPMPLEVSGAAQRPEIGRDAAGAGQRLSNAFLRDPPACVLVLPTVSLSARSSISAAQVDAAVERFLAVRFDHVLAGAHRDRMARHLAVDLANPADLAVFARRMQCRHVLRVSVRGGGLSYAVIWAQRRIGLEISLYRVGAPDQPLWWGRRDGVKGDGDLPLSPLSVAGAMWRAARVAGDVEQGVSLLDDVLRRMLASLPDVRGLAPTRPQPARFSRNATMMPSGSRR